MTISYEGFKYPKGSRLTDADAKDKTDAKRAKAFRDAVWTRDEGKCQACGRHCTRTLTLRGNRGEVHHLRSRRAAPEDLYNPTRAVLVCATCHVLIGLHQLTIKAPR